MILLSTILEDEILDQNLGAIVIYFEKVSETGSHYNH